MNQPPPRLHVLYVAVSPTAGFVLVHDAIHALLFGAADQASPGGVVGLAPPVDKYDKLLRDSPMNDSTS